MDKIKPSEVIATQFKISVESAKYFLGRVQKSFKKEKPPQALIVEFMQGRNRKFKTLPEPHEVATLLKESGAWAHALRAAPPPVIEEDEDIYF